MKSDRHFLNTIQSLLPVQIFICYCFCISGFLVNFAQLLSCIFIWPFHQRLYRRINYYLATLIWSRKFEIFLIEINDWFRINFSLFMVVEFGCDGLC